MEVPPPPIQKQGWANLNGCPTLMLTERCEKIMINESILGGCKKRHSADNEAYDEVILHGEKIPAHRHNLHLRPSSMVVIVCTVAS
jgi:hypothetical protein